MSCRNNVLCIISGIFVRRFGICLLSLLLSSLGFGLCGYTSVTTPYTRGYSHSVNMQNEVCEQREDKQYFNSLPQVDTCVQAH